MTAACTHPHHPQVHKSPAHWMCHPSRTLHKEAASALVNSLSTAHAYSGDAFAAQEFAMCVDVPANAAFGRPAVARARAASSPLLCCCTAVDEGLRSGESCLMLVKPQDLLQYSTIVGTNAGSPVVRGACHPLWTSGSSSGTFMRLENLLRVLQAALMQLICSCHPAPLYDGRRSG